MFKTFERVGPDANAHSTMMAVRVDARAPEHIFCVARDGEVFGSLDDGANWTEYDLPEKAKEIRGLAVG